MASLWWSFVEVRSVYRSAVTMSDPPQVVVETCNGVEEEQAQEDDRHEDQGYAGFCILWLCGVLA